MTKVSVSIVWTSIIVCSVTDYISHAQQGITQVCFAQIINLHAGETVAILN